MTYQTDFLKSGVAINKNPHRRPYVAYFGASLTVNIWMISTPRIRFQIAKLFEITQKDLTKGEKIFDNLLPESLKKNTIYISKNAIILYVNRYCSLLKLDKKSKEKVQDVANNIINIEQILIKGNSSLQAVASMYLVIVHLKLDIDKKKIKDTIEIYSDTILNKIYKSILPYEKLLCNNEYTQEWIETSNKIRERLIIQNKYA